MTGLRVTHCARQCHFGGTIEINLINGFVPSAEEPAPDEFEIITFYTSEGTFDSSTIDLGNGLHFDIDYRLTSIVLVTDEDE